MKEVSEYIDDLELLLQTFQGIKFNTEQTKRIKELWFSIILPSLRNKDK